MLSEVALSEGQAAAVASVADDSADTPEAALARAREIETVTSPAGVTQMPLVRTR